MITIADIAPIHDLLSTLQPGSALTHGALTMIPLLRPGVPEPDWLTLAEAGDTVTITEVNEAGSVPSLTVTSAADRPVLLLDGEELIGAKQNRVLNTSARRRRRDAHHPGDLRRAGAVGLARKAFRGQQRVALRIVARQEGTARQRVAAPG